MDFFEWLEKYVGEVEFVYYIGVWMDIIEFDKVIFDELNVEYFKFIWNICICYYILLVYVSLVVIYGLGEFGYEDNEFIILKFYLFNLYGWLK